MWPYFGPTLFTLNLQSGATTSQLKSLNFEYSNLVFNWWKKNEWHEFFRSKIGLKFLRLLIGKFVWKSQKENNRYQWPIHKGTPDQADCRTYPLSTHCGSKRMEQKKFQTKLFLNILHPTLRLGSKNLFAPYRWMCGWFNEILMNQLNYLKDLLISISIFNQSTNQSINQDHYW